MSAAMAERSAVEGALLGRLLERSPSVDRLPVDILTAAEVAAELERVQSRKAMEADYEAQLVMALAGKRPDTDDPPPGHPGSRRRGGGSPVPGTSEFLPHELAAPLNCSRSFAAGVLSDAHQLLVRMPAVWQACADGELDWYRARIFADVLGAASDAVVAAAVAADEEFAERRREEVERRAGVRVYPTADGMSVLASELPSPVSAAMWSVIDQAAQLARAAGDDRPIGVLRGEAHAALVVDPGGSDRPAFTGHVTVLAPLPALRGRGSLPSSGPGPAAGNGPSVNGIAITAAHLRELVAEMGALGGRRRRAGAWRWRSPTSTGPCWPPPHPRSRPAWLPEAAPCTAGRRHVSARC